MILNTKPVRYGVNYTFDNNKLCTEQRALPQVISKCSFPYLDLWHTTNNNGWMGLADLLSLERWTLTKQLTSYWHVKQDVNRYRLFPWSCLTNVAMKFAADKFAHGVWAYETKLSGLNQQYSSFFIDAISNLP